MFTKKKKKCKKQAGQDCKLLGRQDWKYNVLKKWKGTLKSVRWNSTKWTSDYADCTEENQWVQHTSNTYGNVNRMLLQKGEVSYWTILCRITGQKKLQSRFQFSSYWYQGTNDYHRFWMTHFAKDKNKLI